MEMKYFTVKLCKLSFRELWRMSNGPLEIVIASLLKLFHLPVCNPGGFGLAENVVRLTLDEIPQHVRIALGKLWMECDAIGIRNGFFYTIPILGSNEAFAAALRSPDGRIAAWLGYVRVKNGLIEQEKTRFSFGTILVDGRRIVTSGGKREIDVTDKCVRENWPGRTVDDVFRRHNERLMAIPSEDIVPITNDDELENSVTSSERTEMEFNIARGVYVELSERELEQYQLTKVTEILSRPAKVIASNGMEADS